MAERIENYATFNNKVTAKSQCKSARCEGHSGQILILKLGTIIGRKKRIRGQLEKNNRLIFRE